MWDSYIRLADRRTVALFWDEREKDRGRFPVSLPNQDLYLAVHHERQGLMRYAGFCVILLLAFSSVAGAQGSKQMATTMGNQAFAQLTDPFVKDSLALSPVNASYAGLHQYKRSEERRVGKEC